MGICSSSSHVAVVSQNIQKSKQQPITHPNDNKNNKSDDHDDHILVPAHHKDKFGHEVDNNTGGRVFSEEYYKARNEASEQAKLRGQCFEKSKHAYTSGQKADAKHLSDEGKKHEVLMEQANQRAVHEILAPQHLKESNTIDLHGLYVAEAILATQQYVFCHIQEKHHKTVEIITGAGHHSDPHRGAVLRPAILKLCHEKGWKVEKHPHNDGSFTVHIVP